MRRGLLVIGLLACSHPRPSGPAWPKAHVRETDGGESLAPRAPARAIAATSEDDRAADKPSGDKAPGDKAPAGTPTATGGGTADKPAAGTPSVTVSEEPITGEEIVIEIDD